MASQEFQVAVPRGGVICDPAEESLIIDRNTNMLTGFRYEHFHHVIFFVRKNPDFFNPHT